MEVYRELIQSTEWKKMRILVTEVVCMESKICYIKIHDEINMLEKIEIEEAIQQPRQDKPK